MKKEDQARLVKMAREAIFQGLEHDGRKGPILGDTEGLMEKRATFVTLTIGGQLRGCIGMLEACRPLAEDVACNARSAAFDDPRFMPLTSEEFEQVDIHISVLFPPEEMTFSSEEDLLSQLRPGVDGLILKEGGRRGTFLPSVWEELSKKEDFLMHLKRKAGFSEAYWSDAVQVFRYTAEYFPI